MGLNDYIPGINSSYDAGIHKHMSAILDTRAQILHMLILDD